MTYLSVKTVTPMAINTKTFLSKCNTIVEASSVNLTLNPVMELNYGKRLTRGLIYFDHNKVKRLVEDGTYTDITKLRHVLHMTNASSVRTAGFNEPCLDAPKNHHRQRAVSFDLIFFLIPNGWDAGSGFDYAHDLYNQDGRGISSDGCNWLRYANYMAWDEPGIYTTEHLSKELDKFTSTAGNLSDVIIGYQRFERGNEPIELDVTEVFNKFITGELCNYGIGIAYSPKFEETNMPMSQYVGFFTNTTNSFYEPYVETTYGETIQDDRRNFYLDKHNRLYFYAQAGGRPIALDELPTCEIDGAQYKVNIGEKGAYYVNVNLSSDEYEPDTMLYDTWSNIIISGKRRRDVELSFTTKAGEQYLSLGLPSENTTDSTELSNVTVTASGISDREKIRRGDIRKININCIVKYTASQQAYVPDVQYRVYAMEGANEIDVIRYSQCENSYDGHYFLLDTDSLIPSRYYVDAKITDGIETYIHRELLQFDIVNDRTRQKA